MVLSAVAELKYWGRISISPSLDKGLGQKIKCMKKCPLGSQLTMS